MERWKAVRLIEDAYRKRIQDSLIRELKVKNNLLELEKSRMVFSFNRQILLERQKYSAQEGITQSQRSIAEASKKEAKRYKRQRNALGAVIITYTIVRVFVPP